MAESCSASGWCGAARACHALLRRHAHVLRLDDALAPGELAMLTSLSADAASAVQSLYVSSQRPAVVDPDVLGPDDFRVPGRPHRARGPALRRMAAPARVGRRLPAVARGKTKVTGFRRGKPDLDLILASMYQPLAYPRGHTDPAGRRAPGGRFRNALDPSCRGCRRRGDDAASCGRPGARRRRVRSADGHLACGHRVRGRSAHAC